MARMAVLLQVANVTKAFAERRLLDDVSLTVSEGQRVGFIGRNGAGKSTLLRIIMGIEKPDEGEVVYHPGLRLGYLEQHEAFGAEETVLGYLMRVSGKEDWQCAKTAGLFLLKKELLNAKVVSLSGGYQMRVKLSAMLLPEPNLLLLDEPTNYLDLQTQLLLEDFLKSFRGSFMVVSHDRGFLKSVCTSTLEVERGSLTYFPGELETYFEYKDAEFQMKVKHNKKVEAQREKMQAFVDRFRASKSVQAMSREKAIRKLNILEIEHALKTVRLVIPKIDARKSFALRTLRLAIGYGEKVIASDISFEIQRGDRVAIVGENGKGKTTLLKTMAGLLPPLDGTCTWGNRLTVGYYAQHLHDMLDPKQTVLAYLMAHAAPGLIPEDIQRMAGNFLFTVEDVDKQISVLSGGEKSRLCLAGLLLAKFDVLLLDEPTNHLDVETVEALGRALAVWNGTVFFVSHSRTFVQEVATMILDVRDGSAFRYPGTYADYVADVRRAEGIRDDEPEEEEGSPKKTRAMLHGEVSDARRRLKKLEQELEKYSQEREKLLEQMAADNGAFNLERNQRLATLETLLRFTEDEWIKQGEVVQELERQLAETYASSA